MSEKQPKLKFEEDKERALQNGMNGHIAKPVYIDVLYKTLQRIWQ